jgi:hypothetical protein
VSDASCRAAACYAKGCRPAPENILPERVVSKRELDRWRVRYVARVAGSRYPVHGLVTVLHSGRDIRGFSLARVYTPQSKGPSPDSSLASFTTR